MTTRQNSLYSAGIDGWPVTIQTLKSKRGSVCRTCGFQDWMPGDTKYIVEHDGGREHLCPACAVSRGLPYDEFYRQNQNAPVLPNPNLVNNDISQDGVAATKGITTNSAAPSSTTCCNWCTMHGVVGDKLLELDGRDLEDKVILCLSCASQQGYLRISSGETTYKRRNFDYGDCAKAERTKFSIHEFDAMCTSALNVLTGAQLSSCTLRPHTQSAFFVAWNGVIVLAYQGFPEPLYQAKKLINEHVPNLRTENFGSKWPKTTLGALRKGAKVFALEELQSLRQICQYFSSTLYNQDEAISVTKLSLVEYKCRSLEKLEAEQHLELNQNSFCGNTNTESVSAVDDVVGGWEDLSEYLPKVNNPGSRIDSYRSENGNGITCVAFLHPLPETIHQTIDDFREAVDSQFPERYDWMEEKSWHCTLRSLDLNGSPC